MQTETEPEIHANRNEIHNLQHHCATFFQLPHMHALVWQSATTFHAWPMAKCHILRPTARQKAKCIFHGKGKVPHLAKHLRVCVCDVPIMFTMQGRDGETYRHGHNEIDMQTDMICQYDILLQHPHLQSVKLCMQASQGGKVPQLLNAWPNGKVCKGKGKHLPRHFHNFSMLGPMAKCAKEKASIFQGTLCHNFSMLQWQSVQWKRQASSKALCATTFGPMAKCAMERQFQSKVLHLAKHF